MDAENPMVVRRFLIPLTLGLLVARCTDGPQPTAVQQQQSFAPALSHVLQWAGTSPPRFTWSGVLPGRGGNGRLESAAAGISLDHYTAAFWAVRGQPRSLQINYLSATGDTSSQFLRLTGVDPAYVPGVGDLAPGDSVLITLTIDPASVKISLEPTGLRFDTPAQLRISYGGANGDLNADGVVDDADAYIETRLLGLWYREGADSAWSQIPTAQSIAGKSFTSELPHFSEYAVSW
jgi:hypothetical protein